MAKPVPIRVEGWSPGGGLAQDRGKPLRIRGAFPGELVTVHIEHHGQHQSVGRPTQVHRGHPERRSSPCRQHGRCTGCPLIELGVEAQRQLKRAWVESVLGRELDAFEGGPEFGYRHSAKRVASGPPGAVHLGSYRRGTHDVADMSGCLVEHESLSRAADAAVRALNEHGLTAYDEGAGEDDEPGVLRYVWLRCDTAGQVLLTLVCSRWDDRIRAVAEALAGAVRGVAWAVQDGAGNDARGRALEVLVGASELELEDGVGGRIALGPLGFMQPNPALIAEAYDALVRVPDDLDTRLAFDLYAGAGFTTRRLRQRFAEVTPCESFPESAASLGVEPTTAESFLRAAHERGEAADLVVANPPRRGLGSEVCAALNASGAPRVHIMSCSAASLRRDLDALDAFTVERVVGFDALPQTEHVELVAQLVRTR